MEEGTILCVFLFYEVECCLSAYKTILRPELCPIRPNPVRIRDPS